MLIQAGMEYGMQLGLAFQITDDLLDIGGDASLTGKAVSKDLAHGKMTWPYAVGMEQAEADAEQAITGGYSRRGGIRQAERLFPNPCAVYAKTSKIT